MPTYPLATVQVTDPPPAQPAARPTLMSAPNVATLATSARPASPVLISALPREVDLELYKGDDVWLDLAVSNSDGSDADLSSATPSAQIRAAPNATTIVAAFVAVVDGNLIHLHLPHSEAAKLVPNGTWDAQIATTDGGGTYITTLVAGSVTTKGEVTMP